MAAGPKAAVPLLETVQGDVCFGRFGCEQQGGGPLQEAAQYPGVVPEDLAPVEARGVDFASGLTLVHPTHVEVG